MSQASSSAELTVPTHSRSFTAEEKAETAMGSGKTAGRVSARSSARSGCRCPFGGCVCGSRRSSTALEDRNHFSSIKKTRNQKTLSNARTSENVIVRTLRSAQGGMGIVSFKDLRLYPFGNE